MQYVEAVKYAVDQVNKNQELLPDHELGFAILNDCGGNGAAITKTLQLLPCEPNKHGEKPDRKCLDMLGMACSY